MYSGHENKMTLQTVTKTTICCSQKKNSLQLIVIDIQTNFSPCSSTWLITNQIPIDCYKNKLWYFKVPSFFPENGQVVESTQRKISWSVFQIEIWLWKEEGKEEKEGQERKRESGNRLKHNKQGENKKQHSRKFDLFILSPFPDVKKSRQQTLNKKILLTFALLIFSWLLTLIL